MHRFALDYLREWKTRPTRKPIVVRGARQVGKSFLVRAFAKTEFENLLEINLERERDAASLFASKTPRTIVPLLEARFNTPLRPGRSLLFLDEIQAAPEVFATLRYFHEDMPDLHVVSAGSLLEFVLEDHAFSMPVGRVEYLHLGPMQFEEFMLGMGRDQLREWLGKYSLGETVPEGLHAELMRLLRQFLLVGGLPEAVRAFVESGSYQECDAVKQSVLSTYRDDFGKYGRRVHHQRVSKVFDKIPQLVGRKFMYSQVDREERSRDLGEALHLLCLARVAHRIRHTAANGVPLGAEADDRNFKALFLDAGLLCRALGLSVREIESAEDVLLVNNGAVCEQFIGQHLFYSGPFYQEPELYCWMREKSTSSAELDFVIAIGTSVVPVEVKAGKTGMLKSLHQFLREKGRDFGLRFNSEAPTLLDAQTALPDGRNRPFRLLSLPLYMVGQARRLCAQAFQSPGG
ncbi:MAG: ATP-binding protein [Planctomycetes bacterium]|nr:ATP-binding protein [Planctomycetota bacterium]